MSIELYQKQQQEVAEKAAHMKAVLVEPIIDLGSGKFIMENAVRAERLEAAVGGTIFEGCGTAAPMIAATSSNALRVFANQRGRLPADDLLASAYNAIENIVAFTSGAAKPAGLVFESASLNTNDSAQAMMRDRMIALILPAMLQAVTSNIIGFIPGNFNQSEIFKVWRTAGTTFGDLTAGDRIDWTFNGQYSSMDLRTAATPATGNGVVTSFSIAPNKPIKKKSIKILHDKNIIAADDGNGNLVKVGTTTVNLGAGCTVNYITGAITVVFAAAPANGITVHVAYDVDIEKQPTLIPAINHEMDSRTLRPHEASITAATTLQALWGMRREFNLNIDNMATVGMRNLLAADKDRRHLRDLYFYAKGNQTWTYTVPNTGIAPQEYYENLRQSLLSIDATLMKQTGVSGLVGIVADSKAATIIKSTKFFEPVPGYVRIPQPHYVGRLFGLWDVYEDPQGASYNCLCFAKGREITQAGYVAGDAIPAMTFKHAMQGDLKYNNTLWELAYRDLQPFDGREYLTTLTFTP